MTIQENVDPWLNIQGLFDASFRTLFPQAGLCRQVGFTGISERLSDPPGWFLWLSGAAGAYSLELAAARVLRSNGFRSCVGTWAIRYFPDVDDRSMIWLSAEERALRMTPSFDATGTPAFPDMQRVCGGLFLSGFLDVAWHGGDDSCEFRLRAATGLPPRPDMGSPPPVWNRDGRREQDWLASWTLADKLLLAFGLHQRAAPLRAAVQDAPGSPHGRDKELVVHYRGPCGGAGCVFSLGVCAHVAGDPHAGFHPPTERWINRAWWHAPHMKPDAGDVARPECSCLGSHG